MYGSDAVTPIKAVGLCYAIKAKETKRKGRYCKEQQWKDTNNLDNSLSLKQKKKEDSSHDLISKRS